MSRVAIIITILLSASFLGACGSHLAGGWDGTADVGPIDALPLTVELPEQGLEGVISIHEPQGKANYQICKATAVGDQFVLH